MDINQLGTGVPKLGTTIPKKKLTKTFKQIVEDGFPLFLRRFCAPYGKTKEAAAVVGCTDRGFRNYLNGTRKMCFSSFLALHCHYKEVRDWASVMKERYAATRNRHDHASQQDPHDARLDARQQALEAQLAAERADLEADVASGGAISRRRRDRAVSVIGALKARLRREAA